MPAHFSLICSFKLACVSRNFLSYNRRFKTWTTKYKKLGTTKYTRAEIAASVVYAQVGTKELIDKHKITNYDQIRTEDETYDKTTFSRALTRIFAGLLRRTVA